MDTEVEVKSKKTKYFELDVREAILFLFYLARFAQPVFAVLLFLEHPDDPRYYFSLINVSNPVVNFIYKAVLTMLDFWNSFYLWNHAVFNFTIMYTYGDITCKWLELIRY